MATGARSQTSVNELEQYRKGYPRYSALISSHNSFQLYRRFTSIRTRMLLQKQHEISILEKKLDECDEKEKNPLFLSSVRRDTSIVRQKIFLELRDTMKEYDTLLEQNQRWLEMPNAQKRNIESLRNWIEGTSCIVPTEAAYLDRDRDLFSLTGLGDSIITQIESVLTDGLVWLHGRFRMAFRFLTFRRRRDFTDDEHVFIFGSGITGISRAFMSVLATSILVTPVVILEFVSGNVARLIIIVLAAGAFVLAISLLAKARTVEVLAAGAAYAAVVVTFTNTNTSNQPASRNC